MIFCTCDGDQRLKITWQEIQRGSERCMRNAWSGRPVWRKMSRGFLDVAGARFVSFFLCDISPASPVSVGELNDTEKVHDSSPQLVCVALFDCRVCVFTPTRCWHRRRRTTKETSLCVVAENPASSQPLPGYRSYCVAYSQLKGRSANTLCLLSVSFNGLEFLLLHCFHAQFSNYWCQLSAHGSQLWLNELQL